MVCVSRSIHLLLRFDHLPSSIEIQYKEILYYLNGYANELRWKIRYDNEVIIRCKDNVLYK